MRESIGATWILGIVLTFIALFSGYLAFSVNYSKAFRVKDGIVDRIEKHSGFNQEAIEDINDLMKEINYSSEGNCSTFFTDSELPYIGVTDNVRSNPITDGAYDNSEYNYCVQRIDSFNSNGTLSASYYKVYVFFSLSLPILNSSSTFNISGETTNIYYPNDVFK